MRPDQLADAAGNIEGSRTRSLMNGASSFRTQTRNRPLSQEAFQDRYTSFIQGRR
jgi:hypothetical protein